MTFDRQALIEALRQVPAFAAAPDDDLGELVSSCPVVTLPIGSRLVGQSETTRFALVMLSGEATVLDESPHGESVLATIAAPCLVGEVGALAGIPRAATVIATTPVTALRVEREVLLEICAHNPKVLLAVIGQLGHQIQVVNRVLGLYTGGLAALGHDEVEESLMEGLSHPFGEVRAFASAFAQLARRITHERRARTELASAALIQRSMLPGTLDALPLRGRADVHGAMTPARDVGGDLYDVFMLDDDRLAVMIGDVCGKGVPASLFMSVTMTTLRLAAGERRPLSDVLEAANALLTDRNPTMMFATLFYGVLHLGTGRFEYASCGHNPPFIRRGAGPWVQLPSGGSPLGLVAGKRFPTLETRLDPGDGVFLFTDGVTESLDPDGRDYGEARLARVLGAQGTEAGAPGARALVEAVVADVAAYVGDAEPFDDVTCVALVRL